MKAQTKQTAIAIELPAKSMTMAGAMIKDYSAVSDVFSGRLQQLAKGLEKQGWKPEHFAAENSSTPGNKELLYKYVAQGIQAAREDAAKDDEKALAAVKAAFVAYWMDKKAEKTDQQKKDRQLIQMAVNVTGGRIVSALGELATEAALASMSEVEKKAHEKKVKVNREKNAKKRQLDAAASLNVRELAAALGKAVVEDDKPKYKHGEVVTIMRELFEALGMKSKLLDEVEQAEAA